MDGGCPERELVREAGHRVWPGDSGGTARAQCVSGGQNERVGGGSRVMGVLPCAVSDRATKVLSGSVTERSGGGHSPDIISQLKSLRQPCGIAHAGPVHAHPCSACPLPAPLLHEHRTSSAEGQRNG